MAILSTLSAGPCIIDPAASRDAHLAEAFLRRWGVHDVRRTPKLPRRGFAIVLSHDAKELRETAYEWATGSGGRWLLCEPPADSGPLPGAWPRLVLVQKRTRPRWTPTDQSLIDEEYLRDIAEIAWTGLETRLAVGRSLNLNMVGYLFIAARLLAQKASDPSEVLNRAERFSGFMGMFASREGAFAQAAREWMCGGRPQPAIAGLPRYLIDSLCGRQSPRPSRPAEDDGQLTYDAHLVAAENDEAAWQSVMNHLDLERGLFKRSLSAPLGQWQFHPIMLCALARRLRAYKPDYVQPVFYPEPPVGPGPLRAGRWLERDQEHKNISFLRGSVLTDAARRLDPPALDYPHNFGEWSDVESAEQSLMDEIAKVIPMKTRTTTLWASDKPFCLSIRHDVDRPLTSEDMHWHLELEDRLGCKSSWYFKRETFSETLAGELRDRGREVGYHAELPSQGDDGFAQELTDWLGEAPGMTYHGGLGSEFWRGRPSLEAAVRLGACYSELPVGRHSRPAHWPHDKGMLPVTPLPVKFDVFPEYADEHAQWIMDRGGLLIVEQHPDIMGDGYRKFLEGLVAQKPICMTVREAMNAVHEVGK